VIAGWGLFACLLVVPASYAGYQARRGQQTSDAVERCKETCFYYGDEYFIDEAIILREIDELGGSQAAASCLMDYVNGAHTSARYRWVAIDMLGYCGRDAAWSVPRLRAILFTSREDALERSAAAFAMGRIGSPEAIGCLTFAVRNRNPKVREYAVKALSRTNAPGVEGALLLATTDTCDWVRLVAVRALGRVGTRHALSTLKELNGYDLSAEVRSEAYKAHREIAGR
jgi:HEAT repeat protein